MVEDQVAQNPLDWLELAKASVIVVGAVVAYLTYLRAKRAERVKILLDLHRRFVESDRYSNIRRRLERQDPLLLGMIDFVSKNPNSPFENVLAAESDPSRKFDADLHSAFDDYLGFFELLSHLWTKTHFRLGDIDGLFGYYILRIHKVQEVWCYVQVREFSLDSVLTLVKRIHRRHGK